MPRPPRTLIDGGVYHVYNRGNGRMDLFRSEMDFMVFRKYLKDLKNRLALEIFHYCLMPNHFHFLLRIHYGKDLIILMHRLQLAYARYFANKYEFVGHVFQERFRSPSVTEDMYYLQCGRYIERNPVKAGLVENAVEYAYSSAAYYLNQAPDSLVTPNILFAALGNNDVERRRAYKNFISGGDPYFEQFQDKLVRHG